MLTPVYNTLSTYNQHKNIKFEKLALISKQSPLGFQVLYIAHCAALWLDLAVCSMTNLLSAQIRQHAEQLQYVGQHKNHISLTSVPP